MLTAKIMAAKCQFHKWLVYLDCYILQCLTFCNLKAIFVSALVSWNALQFECLIVKALKSKYRSRLVKLKNWSHRSLLRRKQTYRRILPQETEDDESENDVPAETQNEDPNELQNVTDEDDDHGQNNNSDIYGCENISNDDQNNLSTLNRQNGSSLDSFGMATIPGADELPSRLSPIIRPLPQHMCQRNRNIIQTRSMSRT